MKLPATKHLTPRQQTAIQGRMEEMRRQRYLLECMQAELERYVGDELHIDLRTGQWQLDLDNATVYPIPPSGILNSPK